MVLASAEPVAGADAAAEQESPTLTKRISWARLLKRVFNIDISICSRCAGKIKIIAAIATACFSCTAKACGREDLKVIKQIFEHLGLSSTAPRLAQARGPPQTDQSDFFAYGFYED